MRRGLWLLLAGALLLAAALLLRDGGSPEAGAGQAVARFALSAKPDSFDPRHAGWTSNAVLQRQVYEGLAEYDYLARPFTVAPLLAESWEMSDDGRRWIFRLREDARFHDPEDPPLWPGGTRAVTAQDVIDSWMRQADGEGGRNAWWAFAGLIPGLDAFAAELGRATGAAEREAAWARARAAGVAGLRALDERTLEVRLSRQAPDFLQIVASPYAVVYPREAVERHGSADFLNHPVGSGPFHLEEWRPGDAAQAVLRRTPGWRGQPDPSGAGTLPHLDELRFSHVAEGNTRTLMFLRGQIDRLPPLQDSFDSLVQGEQPAPELAAAGVTLEVEPIPNLTYLGFNMRDPVVGAIEGDEAGNARRLLLRRAIALAFPYDRWHRVLRNGLWAEPARSFLPAGLPEAGGAPDCPDRRSDLAEARRLLAEAGWEGGAGLPQLRFEMSGSSTMERDIADIFRAGLAEIGIECEAVPNNGQAFGQKLHAGQAQLFLYMWTLDWPDAGNLLQLWYGPNAAPGDNFCNYASADFDALFTEFRSRAPGPERSALAHGMLALLYRDLPAVPIDHGRSYLLVQPWLKTGGVHPFDPFACKYYRREGH